MYMPYISIHVISLRKQVIYLCLKYINIISYVDDNMTTSNKSPNSNHPRPLLLHSTAPSRLSPSIALWPWWPWPRRAPCHGLRRLASRFFLEKMSSQLRLLQIPSRIPTSNLPPHPPPQKKRWVQYFSHMFFRYINLWDIKQLEHPGTVPKLGGLDADVF